MRAGMSAQWYLTPCDPIDCSPPGSCVHGIFQARVLEWGAIVFSALALWILWTVGYQAPLSMGFFRQEYWSGLPLYSPGDLPDPGIKPTSPVLQADCLPTEPLAKTISVVTSSTSVTELNKIA